MVAHQERLRGSDLNGGGAGASAVLARRADRVEEAEQLLIVRWDQTDLSRPSRKRFQRHTVSVFGTQRVERVLQAALDRRVVIADGINPVSLPKLVISFTKFLKG